MNSVNGFSNHLLHVAFAVEVCGCLKYHSKALIRKRCTRLESRPIASMYECMNMNFPHALTNEAIDLVKCNTSLSSIIGTMAFTPFD